MKCPHCGKPISGTLIVKEAGRIGGKKIAKRGPEYFRQLQAKRKTKAGGRPPKEITTAGIGVVLFFRSRGPQTIATVPSGSVTRRQVIGPFG